MIERVDGCFRVGHFALCVQLAEEFDGLGDGRRAHPTVHNKLKDSANGGTGGVGRTLLSSSPHDGESRGV
jgi:hypothetical protein